MARIEDEVPLSCDECGRKPGPDENVEDEWRTYYRDGLGDGVTVCPECAELLRANSRLNANSRAVASATKTMTARSTGQPRTPR
jgi:hypothetical protein